MSLKIFLLLLLGVSAQAEPAVCAAPRGKRTVPCKPPPLERAELMEAINEAVTLRRERDALLLSELPPVEKLRDLSWGELVDWKNRFDELETAETKMREQFKKVLQLAEQSYGVRAAVGVSRIAGGEMKGELAVWNPIIQESQDLVFRSLRVGKTDQFFKFNNLAGDFATTFDDGTVMISYRTLERCVESGNPAFLAATIAHEAAHFDALVARGWRGYHAEQVSAYTAEMRVGSRIGLDGDDLSLARERLATHRVKESSEALSGIVKPAHQPAEQSDANAGEFADVQDDLRDIRVKRDALIARFEREADERMRRLRDSANDPSPPAAPAVLPQPVFPAELPRPVEPAFVPQWTINALAAAGCLDPWAKPQEELDFDWARLRGTAYRPDWADSMSLSGCQRVLFLRLLSMASAGTPERLTRDTFAAIAAEARSPAPPADDVPEAVRGTQPPDRPRCRYMGDWCN